jgi:hypothetical protein
MTEKVTGEVMRRLEEDGRRGLFSHVRVDEFIGP